MYAVQSIRRLSLTILQPHIARYENYFEDGDMMYIVMECACRYSLGCSAHALVFRTDVCF
jgi:hypothetical protein